MSILFRVNHLSHQLAGKEILSGISFSILSQQHWYITGPSGSGKTTLLEKLAFYNFNQGSIETAGNPRVAYLRQQHQFRTRSNTNDFYYQQRFQSMDAEDSATVTEYIGEEKLRETRLQKWIAVFKIEPLLEKPLIQLSNGENRRVQLLKSLSAQPEVLLMDNPFLGLDTGGRATLHNALGELAEAGMQLIITGPAKEIPAFITHILHLEEGKMLYAGAEKDFSLKETAARLLPHTSLPENMPPVNAPFETVVKLNNVHVQYGQKTILNQLNWEIKKGEKWLLSGENGSGKSTLISLITGDNPQAYANDIVLFDRKRGTGESIWDIKKKIGYVSPELHLSFDKFSTAANIIGSGFFDTIGLFRQLNARQENLIREWLRKIDAEDVYNKPMISLPLGMQRMLLVIRAFIKNPPFLILDEPCQGLDESQKEKILWLADLICAQPETALLYVSHYSDEAPSVIQHRFQL